MNSINVFNLFEKKKKRKTERESGKWWTSLIDRGIDRSINYRWEIEISREIVGINYFVMGICNWEKRKVLFVHEMNWPLMSLIGEKSGNKWTRIFEFVQFKTLIDADFLISLNWRRNELLIADNQNKLKVQSMIYECD